MKFGDMDRAFALVEKRAAAERLMSSIKKLAISGGRVSVSLSISVDGEKVEVTRDDEFDHDLDIDLVHSVRGAIASYARRSFDAASNELAALGVEIEGEGA